MKIIPRLVVTIALTFGPPGEFITRVREGIKKDIIPNSVNPDPNIRKNVFIRYMNYSNLFYLSFTAVP